MFNLFFIQVYYRYSLSSDNRKMTAAESEFGTSSSSFEYSTASILLLISVIGLRPCWSTSLKYLVNQIDCTVTFLSLIFYQFHFTEILNFREVNKPTLAAEQSEHRHTFIFIGWPSSTFHGLGIQTYLKYNITAGCSSCNQLLLVRWMYVRVCMRLLQGLCQTNSLTGH